MHYFANLKDENFIGDKYATVFDIRNSAGRIEYKREMSSNRFKTAPVSKPKHIPPAKSAETFFVSIFTTSKVRN